MTAKEKLHQRIEKMNETELEWLQQVLEQQRRENLKRLARELADSTEEERDAFLEHLKRSPWSTRADP
jgi:hypothetical protein